MGEIRETPPPALLFIAAFSQSNDLLDHARRALEESLGPPVLTSKPFLFDDTAYYADSMGPTLIKQLWAFDRIIPVDDLPRVKKWTNIWEDRFTVSHPLGVARSINLDPGLVDAGKVMLASTKDNSHRIYMGQGIFGEVTLYLRHGIWQAWPWTYSDYRRAEVHEFLLAARARFLELRRDRSVAQTSSLDWLAS